MSFESEFMPRVRRSRKWKEYQTVCFRFCRYLDTTEQKSFTLHGIDTVTCTSVITDIPYVHRFSSVYLRSIYAKFSLLQDWYKENPVPVHLLSLTTSSRGKTIREAFEDLRFGWRGLSNCLRDLRKKYPERSIEYIYVFEPHKSGYPHMHVVLFGKLEAADIDRLKKLWSDKYKLGSYAHGLDISSPSYHQDITYVRAYVLKYIQKTLDFTDMTVAHFVFLAVLWSFYDKSKWVWKEPYWTKTGKFLPRPDPEKGGGGVFRLWGCSRALSAVMKKKEAEYDVSENSVSYSIDGEIPAEILSITERAHKNIILPMLDIMQNDLKE